MFRHPLARELARLLTFKLIALVALYAVFFAPSHRPPIDPSAHIAGTDAVSPSEFIKR